jgi:hypothetical protein
VCNQEVKATNVLEFITSGKEAASMSHVTTAVSNARCGFIFVFVAGGHFRINCLTIGKSVDTGSPYACG